eukprot:GSMAST32.ASY1.ANO1.176.1 assembled CDS
MIVPILYRRIMHRMCYIGKNDLFQRNIRNTIATSAAQSAIGIAGGVGPMAGCLLHKMIIENTLTLGGGDQGHLDIFHLSKSRIIPDRTNFITQKKGEDLENPGDAMFEVVNSIFSAVNSNVTNRSNHVVIGVPCNTFHASVIWDPFKEKISTLPNVKLLHMIDETANFIRKVSPKTKKVGLMSTSGTRLSNVYPDTLCEFQFIEVSNDAQSTLHDAIYNPEWGVKATFPVTKKARNIFVNCVNDLKDMGAEVIILGCTEIPIALPEKELFDVPLMYVLFFFNFEFIFFVRNFVPNKF